MAKDQTFLQVNGGAIRDKERRAESEGQGEKKQ
jgi:hypothetical protein